MCNTLACVLTKLKRIDIYNEMENINTLIPASYKVEIILCHYFDPKLA